MILIQKNICKSPAEVFPYNGLRIHISCIYFWNYFKMKVNPGNLYVNDNDDKGIHNN